MTDRPLAAIVLAAGKSTRMRSDLPKVLHPLAGRPILSHVLDAVAALAPARTVVVVGPDMAPVAALAAPHQTVVQERPEGSGHAVLCARKALADLARPGSDLLILFGDTPLVEVETFRALVAARDAAPRPDLVLLGFRPAEPRGYGRILCDDDGQPAAIVEERDASDAQRRIDLCNGGLMLVDGGILFALLDKVGKDNAKGEYYLTDLVALARAAGHGTAVVETELEQVMGINTRAELAIAEAVLQSRLRGRALAGGATLVDPTTVWFSWDTRLGRDVTVQPNVFFGPGVVVGDDVEIRAFCHLEGVRIEAGAKIGPFARLRPDSVIGVGARIGNFVEVKNATFGEGAKANHLAYVGDSRVGVGANVGAGVITCNYDGFAKHATEIGAGAFIGSNVALVAPVTVGAGAIVGAGSTIVEDVPADAVAVGRGRQENRAGGAARLRARRGGAKRKAAEG